MANTPIYSFGLWAGPQAMPWVQHDTNLRVIEALLRGSVADRDLAAPPGSCADGAAYLVAGSATGAWAGKSGQMAVAVGANASNGWAFVIVALEGAMLWVEDEDLRLEYLGGTWAVAATSGVAEAPNDGQYYARRNEDWEAFSPGGGGGAWYFNPPAAADLSTLLSPDANNLTLNDDADVGLLVDPGTVTTNDDLRCAVKTIPSPSSDWSVEIAVQALLQGTNYTGVGLVIRDSVGGKCHTWRIASQSTGTAGALTFTCTRWTSINTFSAETLSRIYQGVMEAAFLRIRQVSGTYHFDRSHNGKQWQEHTTQANNAFLAAPADQVGIVATVNNSNADSRSYFNVLRWAQSW